MAEKGGGEQSIGNPLPAEPVPLDQKISS